MKKFLLTYLLLTIHLSLGANMTIPNKFYIDQAMTYTNHAISSIRSDEEDIGLILLHVFGDVLSGRIPQFDLYTSKDGIVAIAKVEVTDRSNRVVFNVSDQEGSFLGTIEESWETTFIFPIVEVYSVNHELIAKGYHDIWGHNFTVIDPINNHVLATLSSGPFTWTWIVNVQDSESIKQLDNRLFLLSAVIPMYSNQVSSLRHGSKLIQNHKNSDSK